MAKYSGCNEDVIISFTEKSSETQVPSWKDNKSLHSRTVITKQTRAVILKRPDEKLPWFTNLCASQGREKSLYTSTYLECLPFVLK